jgi:hypothetical protein
MRGRFYATEQISDNIEKTPERWYGNIPPPGC